MSTGGDINLTRMLASGTSGDPAAAELLWRSLYEDLRITARTVLRGDGMHRSPGETTLIHELYLKSFAGGTTTQWESRRHFFGSMARAMAQIVIDHRRASGRVKRGGDRRAVPLLAENDIVANFDQMLEVADSGLIEALNALQKDAPLSADVVWLRYIAGLSVDQTARALHVSPRTVNNHWLHARAWLRRAMSSD